VGKVGSGKSTVAKLILGLYQPDSGAILIDGVDSRQLDPADLRRNVGTVMQDVWLMTGSVKQNIAIGGVNPSDQEILDASVLAGVHDFISQHPDGYGLRLKERGEGLSGGQKQAITIARALVGRPPIVLLDEPTSAMDLPGEKALIERLKAELINQTIVVITHRSSIIELIDHVLVMDQGRLVAHGPKSDFLKPRPQGPEQSPVVQAPSGQIGAAVSDNFGYGKTG
jgi:ATP-binding cassette subfamily C protein LapB